MATESEKKAWLQATDGLTSNLTYQESAEALRKLVKTKLLTYFDIEKNPAKFFEFHRMVVDPRKRGAGFLIRFTVQYNLFAGTVLGLGNDQQVESLNQMQENGDLGCFALTEKLAGVNSGMIVNCAAEWNKKEGCFIVNTKGDGSEKNWISQGLTANKCALIASLIIDGKNYGPHGFLVDIRDRSKGNALVEGVEVIDMGVKTTANDLDNAVIRFKNLKIKKDCLLSKYATIDAADRYVQTTEEKMRIEIIGQRLLSGRVAVAQAALKFWEVLFETTKKFSDSKKCWSPNGNQALSLVPQLSEVYREGERERERLKLYSALVEEDLCQVLRGRKIPSPELISKIAVCKVQCVDTAILYCFRLKQEIGSYALMVGSGFEHDGLLQCCRFAEGDSQILRLKLSRDYVKSASPAPKQAQRKVENHWRSTTLRDEIDEKVLLLRNAGKDKWDENYKTVFELANLICEEVIQRTVSRVGSKL